MCRCERIFHDNVVGTRFCSKMTYSCSTVVSLVEREDNELQPPSIPQNDRKEQTKTIGVSNFTSRDPRGSLARI